MRPDPKKAAIARKVAEDYFNKGYLWKWQYWLEWAEAYETGNY